MSHSFGSISSTNGRCAWFHFLCKHIRVAAVNTPAGPVPTVAHLPTGFQPWAVSQDGAELALLDPTEGIILPQADYSYSRSSFFLSTNGTGAVTLCCFGASPRLRQRFERFLGSRAWNRALDESYILLDLILDCLYLEVDDNVWSMNTIFGALEHVSYLVTGVGAAHRQRTRVAASLCFNNTSASTKAGIGLRRVA